MTIEVPARDALAQFAARRLADARQRRTRWATPER
jgi:hypothetical protein